MLSVTAYLPSTATYSYDSNGNLLSDGKRTFTYDDENQLNSVIVTNNGAGTSTMLTNIYDGKMRRRIAREFTWSSGWVQTNEIHYVYDGNVVIQEREINNLPTVAYTRGKDLSGSLQGAGGIGGLLARTDQSSINSPLSICFYHAGVKWERDRPNQRAAIYRGQISLRSIRKYSLPKRPMKPSPTAFRQREFYQDSGLVYYLYRFYDANSKRWP